METKQISILVTEDTPFVKEYEKINKDKTSLYFKALRILGAKIELSIYENSMLFSDKNPFIVSCSIGHFNGVASYSDITGRGGSNIEAMEDFLNKCFKSKKLKLFSFGGPQYNVIYRFDEENMKFVKRETVSTLK